ncbi:MAG: pitrilysin family protein [Rhodothermales bacterium]|nr:pitrilysin family protein [Rhodothermales bacterium]
MQNHDHAEFDFVDESGGIREYRLKSNGLQVLLMTENSAPVATFMVTYRVGSRNETGGLTGATHFLEHLMFKGSRRFNKDNGKTVFNVLQRLGAQVNATTWYDRTNYYESIPSEHLSLAIEIEADRMRGALLREDDVASEKTVILNELDRGENEPVRKLFHSVWSSAFVAHPYHHPTIGWRSDVENTTADGLRGFYDTYYWPNNAAASVIGDFDRHEALSLVARHFGTIKPSPQPIPEIHTVEPPQRGERRVVVRQEGQLGSVMMAFKQPPAHDADTAALDLLGAILSVGKSSRLYRSLVDPGRATHVFSSASFLRDPGLFCLFAMLSPGVEHEEVEEIIYTDLQRVVSDGVEDTEVARSLNQLTAQYAFGRDGSFAIASQLNEAIAAGDWRLYTTALDRAKAVTRADIQRVAGKYLVRDQMTVGYYLPYGPSAKSNGLPNGD